MTSKEVKAGNDKVVRFGRERRKDFLFDEGFQNLNHGE
jgi:hypothetical protein